MTLTKSPTYLFDRVKQLLPHNRVITERALKTAHELGFDGEDIDQILCQELKPEHFFKTMPAEKKPGLWQDVYKLQYLGVPLYLKLQLSASTTQVVVVISLTEDESASLNR